MKQIILILLLMICGWNVTGSLLSQHDSHFISESDSVHSLKGESDLAGTAISAHPGYHDENSCENEGCQNHRCHLGHCNFIASAAILAILPLKASALPLGLDQDPTPIYLSYPTKPPCT